MRLERGARGAAERPWGRQGGRAGRWNIAEVSRGRFGENEKFDFEKRTDRIFGISRSEAGQPLVGLWSALDVSGEALACLRPGNDGKIIPGPLD